MAIRGRRNVMLFGGTEPEPPAPRGNPYTCKNVSVHYDPDECGFHVGSQFTINELNCMLEIGCFTANTILIVGSTFFRVCYTSSGEPVQVLKEMISG